MDNTPLLQIGFDGHYVVYLWGGHRVTGAFTRNPTHYGFAEWAGELFVRN
jgi:hypothetical protein